MDAYDHIGVHPSRSDRERVERRPPQNGTICGIIASVLVVRAAGRFHSGQSDAAQTGVAPEASITERPSKVGIEEMRVGEGVEEHLVFQNP